MNSALHRRLMKRMTAGSEEICTNPVNDNWLEGDLYKSCNDNWMEGDLTTTGLQLDGRRSVQLLVYDN
jgi:hypothetical protein